MSTPADKPRRARSSALLRRMGQGGARYEITEAGLELIRTMAAGGHTNATIAAALRIKRHTLVELRRRDERVQEALERGRGELEDLVVHRLLEIGRSNAAGNVTALIWLSKNRLGWRDNPVPDGAVNVQVNNFGAGLTTGDIRTRLAALLAQRERLLTDGGDDGAQ